MIGEALRGTAEAYLHSDPVDAAAICVEAINAFLRRPKTRIWIG